MFNREIIRNIISSLAAEAVFIGTSSWKYELCRARHNSYFAAHRIMPGTGQDSAIGEGITSFLMVTLGIIKGFVERPEPGRADDSDATGR
jgi:hypothetical protein